MLGAVGEGSILLTIAHAGCTSPFSIMSLPCSASFCPLPAAFHLSPTCCYTQSHSGSPPSASQLLELFLDGQKTVSAAGLDSGETQCCTFCVTEDTSLISRCFLCWLEELATSGCEVFKIRQILKLQDRFLWRAWWMSPSSMQGVDDKCSPRTDQWRNLDLVFLYHLT